MLRRLITLPVLTPITPQPAPRWPLYAGIVAAVGLSLVLYVNTLSLPFFQDDVIHIRWLSTHSVLDPFLTAENLPTYRPLGESLLKLWSLILSRHDPAVLRLQNILMHALNAVLVAVLVLRLDRTERRYRVAGLAALLFAVFPFAYQAVIWVNVFFYPLGTLLLLLAALSYWRARTTGLRRWLAFTWLLCFLAPAEIEWGLMSGAILFGLEILWWLQKRQTRPWVVGPAVGLTINVIFFVIWQIVPKFDYGSRMAAHFGIETLLQMSTYYLQGLIYPTAPLAVPLVDRLGITDLTAIRLVALVTLVPMLIILIRRKRVLLGLSALAWFGLLILPTWVTVDFDYVINSPRLLYPAAPGIVLLWGVVLVELLERGRWLKTRTLMVALAVGVVVAHNIAFVHVETRLYHLAEEPVHTLAAAARAAPRDDVLLFVNLPAWLAPQERAYALGNHGVQFITAYADIKDVIFAANGVDHDSRAVSFVNVNNVVPYYVGLLGAKLDWDGLVRHMQQTGSIYLTRYAADRIQLLPAGRVTAVEPGPVSARLGSVLELGATQLISRDQALEVILNYRLLQTADQDLAVFVHMYDAAGQLVAQSDGYPLLGLAPLWLWPAGQTLQDRHTIPWPTATPAGSYQIGFGVYDRGSGLRLTAVTIDGTRLPNDTVVIGAVSRP